MRKSLIAFLCGALFSVGLALGGMTRPEKVIGFLDFFGRWDPTLLGVMGGALLCYIPAYQIARRRKLSFCGDVLQMPAERKITPRLLTGSALFGVGWGLSGFCPGPAVASLGAGLAAATMFVFFMIVGMAAATWALKR